jgi:hypothetical protein
MTDEPPDFNGVALRGAFYKGAFAQEVSAGMTKQNAIVLQRDPQNQYDRNAIKALVDLGILGQVDIGWVGKEWAAEIAPWMDSGWFFTVEFVRPYGRWLIVNIHPIRPAKQVFITEREELVYAH